MTRVIGAVDIGGTKIAVGLISEEGEVLAETRWQTDRQESPMDGVRRIADALKALEVQNGIKMIGVGIGLTGRLDPMRGVMAENAFLVSWGGFALADSLSTLVECPVYMENDADAAALGEYYWGAGKGAHSMVYVTVSTGIGAGIILNGQLYRGVDGAHPEIGHHVIADGAGTCYCGGRGCWQTMASGTAMAERFQNKHPEKPMTTQEICQAALTGDSDALCAVAEEARYLGLGLANLITFYLPERIVLGGGVMESFELFEHGIQRTIQETCGMVPHERVRLLPAVMCGGAGLIGAGAVFLHRSEHARKDV